MALVDPGRRRVDDHEHLGREVLAAPVEDDARDVDQARILGAIAPVEMKRGQPVLAVDDQVLAVGLHEVADAVESAGRLEAEPLGREQQDRPRDRRLAHRRLVEVRDRAHLDARELALEGAVAPFHAGDEPCHLVVVGLLRRDLFPLAVVAAHELHLLEQVGGRIRDEVENAFLLPDLGREHVGFPPVLSNRHVQGDFFQGRAVMPQSPDRAQGNSSRRS